LSRSNLARGAKRVDVRWSALVQARANALLRYMNRGGLVLDDSEYRRLRWRGFTRAGVDSALNCLLARGEVTVEPSSTGALVVTLVDQQAKESAV